MEINVYHGYKPIYPLHSSSGLLFLANYVLLGFKALKTARGW